MRNLLRSRGVVAHTSPAAPSSVQATGSPRRSRTPPRCHIIVVAKIYRPIFLIVSYTYKVHALCREDFSKVLLSSVNYYKSYHRSRLDVDRARGRERREALLPLKRGKSSRGGFTARRRAPRSRGLRACPALSSAPGARPPRCPPLRG